VVLNPKSKKMLISLVVPVYNSEGTITELCTAISNVFENRIYDYEIILVDDASKDNSWEKISSLTRENDKIKGIKLAQNKGQLSATTCGIYNAKGEWIITIDDDLQYHPNEILKLIKEKEKSPEYYLILGYPTDKKQHFVRKNISAVIQVFSKLLLPPAYFNKKLFSSFRLIDRKLLNHKNKNFNLHFIWEIPANKIKCIPVVHHPRKYKKSNYTFIKLIKELNAPLLYLLKRFLLFLLILSVLGTLFMQEIRWFLFNIILLFMFLFVQGRLQKKTKIKTNL
jgi:polyisoprenyl-phosphate glycosyltransferase